MKYTRLILLIILSIVMMYITSIGFHLMIEYSHLPDKILSMVIIFVTVFLSSIALQIIMKEIKRLRSSNHNKKTEERNESDLHG